MFIGNLEVYGVIYKITNTINKKVYIGQTVSGFKKRYNNNLIKYTHNNHIKNSILKYGIENFEVVEVLDVAFSSIELGIKEDIYINIYKSTNPKFGYNKKYGGVQGKLSEERLVQMSMISKNNWNNKEYREKTVNGLRKAFKNEDVRIKISNSIKNSKKHKDACNSIEFRRKMSINKLNLWKNNEFKEKAIKGMKNSWTDERRKISSNRTKKQHEDIEYTKKLSDVFKKRWENKDEREKLKKSMMRTYILKNIYTNEIKEFIGRKSLADYIGMSEAYVKKRLSDKKLYLNTYLIERKHYCD